MSVATPRAHHYLFLRRRSEKRFENAKSFNICDFSFDQQLEVWWGVYWSLLLQRSLTIYRIFSDRGWCNNDQCIGLFNYGIINITIILVNEKVAMVEAVAVVATATVIVGYHKYFTTSFFAHSPFHLILTQMKYTIFIYIFCFSGQCWFCWCFLLFR